MPFSKISLSRTIGALAFVLGNSVAFTLGNAQQPSARSSTQNGADPILGIWSLDSKQETYKYVITFWPGGIAEQLLLNEKIPSTWRHLKNGRYTLKPGGGYMLIKNGRLEDWDRQGFIRGYKRIGSLADLPAIPQKKPESAKTNRAPQGKLTIMEVRPLSQNRIQLAIRTDLPRPIAVIVTISLHGQADDDVYIGAIDSVRVDSSQQKFILNASKDLPNGTYDILAEVFPNQIIGGKTHHFDRIADSTRIALVGGSVSAKDEEARQQADRWLLETFYLGMPWKREVFVRHLGQYEIIPAELGHHKGYYFPKINTTVLVNLLTKTATAIRSGRTGR